MTDILAEICDYKRKHVAERKQAMTEAMLLAATTVVRPPRPFERALRDKTATGRTALITEIKKASPSKGLIREDFDPASLARAYEQGGATCLSVLTDVRYFQGHDKFLGEARGACSLPILRKDFMVDPYQVVEARAIGADCILIIMAAVDDILARDLEHTARQFGMGVLVEVHDEAELERALRLDSQLIGINNRNLKTLEIDLANTEKMAPSLPPEYLVVCESGIYHADDIKRMEQVGVRTFLIGESLMRQEDVTGAVHALLH